MRLSALACPLFAASLAAQSPIVPAFELERIERQWPTASPGTDTHLACGRFVAGHPARGAVVVRNSRLHLWLAPAHFDHCVPTSFLGAGSIATIPSAAAAPDLLAVATEAGLRVLRYAGGTFVDAAPGQGALPAWTGARDLDVLTLAAPLPMTYVLAHAPGWIRVAIVDADGTVSPSLAFPAPPGITVLDADLIDWVPGGAPEIVAVLSNGTFVLDGNGTVLAAAAQPADAAVVAPLRTNPTPAFAQARELGGVWRIETFAATGSFVPIDGGTLPVASAVLGLATFDANGDAWTDLVVSTGESTRRILVGRAEGFSAASAHRIDFLDVDAADLPPIPLPNRASLYVDDIDRDGNDDFVVCHRDTGRLVVTTRVRPQVQFAAYGIEDEGGTQATLEFLTPLAGAQNLATLPVDDAANQTVYVARIKLPTTLLPSQALDAIVYPRPMVGTEPLPDDPADLQAAVHVRFALPPDSAGKRFDFLLPVPTDLLSAPAMGPNPRVLVEFTLVEAAIEQPQTSTAPVFAEFARNPWMLKFEDLLLTLDPAADASWWFDECIELPVDWATAGMEPTGDSVPPPDARYFGAVVALRQPKVGGTPSVPTQKSGTGVAH
ncbi:MAG: hypothetical protein KF830_00230 [Planctomycetes bacterium]|nr:hypothetical protein [Planctomycetota bacterium]